MPKQAKSVQIRHKVSKYVVNVWRWRTPTGDRSAAAGSLVMIYTVYKDVGMWAAADFHGTIVWIPEGGSIWNPLESELSRSLLRSWQTADFHNTAQIICNNITCLRDTTLNAVQFERCWKWVETFGVSFAAWGVLPCTVWYTPIATSDDGQKCPPCAEVCYDRVSTNLQPFDSKGSKTRLLNLSLTIE